MSTWNSDPFGFVREARLREQRRRRNLVIFLAVLIFGTFVGLRIYGELTGACHDVPATCYTDTTTGSATDVLRARTGVAYPCTHRVCE